METFKANILNQYEYKFDPLATDKYKVHRCLNKIFEGLKEIKVENYSLELFAYDIGYNRVSYSILHEGGNPHPLDIDMNKFENFLAIVREHEAKLIKINLSFKISENSTSDTVQVEI